MVEPEEYDALQQQIIDVLYQWVDPETGRRPVCLALGKEDARMIGLHGDNIGDVVYAVYASFGTMQHDHNLPTASHGIGSLKPLFNLFGPGIKTGITLDRTIWLADLVPTLCYIMDWPVPEQTEGAVVYQALNK